MKLHYLPIVLLAVGLVCSYWLAYTPALLALVYFVVSVISYGLYAKDKKAAKNRQWRVPENTLHFCALLGGWPGAILAQQVLRHKTQKVSFRVAFGMTVLLNSSLLVWLHTPDGSQRLHYYTYKAESWAVNRFGANAGARVLLGLTKFHQLR